MYTLALFNRAQRENRQERLPAMVSMGTGSQDEIAQVLASIHTESGASLLALVEASPVLLVFLRHFGCSFCRQAISDVAELKGELDKRGVRPVFVHLGTPERAKPFFDYYGIGDVERVSDPEAAVYRLPVFALPRMHPALTLFQSSVWVGWLKGALFKHGIGAIKEDGHQMQGIFFFKGSKIVRQFRYKTIADEPNYLKLVA
jgi:thiol-disulfide isomerase/thioredoxin